MSLVAFYAGALAAFATGILERKLLREDATEIINKIKRAVVEGADVEELLELRNRAIKLILKSAFLPSAIWLVIIMLISLFIPGAYLLGKSVPSYVVVAFGGICYQIIAGLGGKKHAYSKAEV